VTFPFVLAPNALESGFAYTLTLFAEVQGFSTLISSGSVIVMVNAPPSSRLLSCSPSQGVAFLDIFTISAIGWTDDASDLPLQYDYGYRLSLDANLLTLGPHGVATFASTYLPSGTSAMNNSISLSCFVTDIWGASTNALTSVRVIPLSGAQRSSNITDVLLTSLLGNNGDTSSEISTINLVASMMASDNCLLAPHCLLLNRSECGPSTFPSTCGACLANYFGIDGSSNEPCYEVNANTTILNNPDSSCHSNDDCFYQI
jgi:hypothetical protein